MTNAANQARKAHITYSTVPSIAQSLNRVFGQIERYNLTRENIGTEGGPNSMGGES